MKKRTSVNYENFENENNATKYLFEITGNLYCFAAASDRKWGKAKRTEHMKENPFYQIMPFKKDDGFFNWYCSKREYFQFFKSKEMCVLYFILYWMKWKKLSK